MLCLKKRLSFLLPCSTARKTTLSSYFSAFATQNPPPKPHFMVDYLIASCGLSPNRAMRASKPIAHLKSSHKPDSVVHFLGNQGLNDTHITRLISLSPRLLCSDVEKTLEPKIRALRDMGFTSTELAEILVSNPHAMRCRSSTLVHRIKFWRALLGNNHKDLHKALKRNFGLIDQDIAKNITPKITLLKKYGLSDHSIRFVVLMGKPIARNLTSIEALLKQTQELGFRQDSLMFAHGLVALSSITRSTLKTKMELLKTFGWSEHEFLSAFLRFPSFALLSEKNIRAKMEFLVERAGCMQSYIALHPLLLSFSMSKRLLPRHHVLQVLKLKEAVGTEWDFSYVMECNESMFVKKFILRFKDEAPDLHESYIAACAGKLPV